METKNETPAAQPAQSEMTPIAAIQNLAIASREARLTANEHDLIRKSVEVLLNFVKEFKPELLTPTA